MESEILQNENAGYYIPSFFRIHINTTQKIERIENLSKDDFSTLMHEYIHFIQDITTVYGLGNIYNTVQYLKYAVNEVYKCGDKFEVPIIVKNNTLTGSFIRFSNVLGKYTYGNVQNYNGKLFNIIEDKVNLKGHLNMSDIRQYTMKIDVPNYGCYEYSFGAGCIKETMASIMEKKLSGPNNGLPEHPYSSAIQVCDYYYPKFSRNELRVLALCDISLNSSNPAYTFIKLLNDWKKKNFIPNDARDLYKDFFENGHFMWSQETANGVFKQKEDFFPIFEEYIKTAKDSLHAYFVPNKSAATDEWAVVTNQLNGWIDDILNSAVNWRRKNPSFIIDVAEGGTHKNQTLISLYNDFGLPFCTNTNHEACFYHPNIDTNDLRLYYFMAIRQMLKIFSEGYTGKCEMYDYCNKCQKDNTGNVHTSQKCFNPWMRDNEDDLCPFATMWVHWNLKGKQPYNASYVYP